MPLPLILAIGAGIAVAGGVTTGVDGGIKMKNADRTMKRAIEKRDEAIKNFELQNSVTTREMDDLGKLELEICSEFEDFANVLEKIQGRPEFKEYIKDDAKIPLYNPEELKEVSVGAGLLIGGLGGAALGTSGGFAAAGVTTSAVMALGTASTGTAISSLSGAAATNATLAAIGGGSIAAGGGGIALGTTILGASTFGVGLLVGGIVFDIAGTNLSKKADDAYYQALTIERQVAGIIAYLKDLKICAQKYGAMLSYVRDVYNKEFALLKDTVITKDKTEWILFDETEKNNVQNCVLLIGLLYKMCKVSLVVKDENSKLNVINSSEVSGCLNLVDNAMKDLIEVREE